MSAPRFYCPGALGEDRIGTVIALPAPAAHHAVRVVRLKSGDPLTLFDGTGGEYAAVLTTIDKHGARARLERFAPTERESPLALTLVQAVIASDAMDYVVRKAVELGAFALVPVVTERSAPFPAGDRGARRVAHWAQIAIAAAEQSGRNRVPTIHAPCSLGDWLRDWRGPALLGAPGAAASIAHLPPLGAAHCALVVGPEGGFTGREAEQLELRGVRPLSLGPRILRAETAALVMLAIVQARSGDLA